MAKKKSTFKHVTYTGKLPYITRKVGMNRYMFIKGKSIHVKTEDLKEFENRPEFSISTESVHIGKQQKPQKKEPEKTEGKSLKDKLLGKEEG
ncbi:TPA_asm: hypothetical protein vir519_00024 [Caudoviricetes sp. vir519]|nr:TPA_asm: hypothetical protein vir519_00024 [Caudoviricetes sp. vir519]